MKKNDCNIVKDLLPSYIEKLTSEESNFFIEAHLKKCDNCKKILHNMKVDEENSKKNNLDENIKHIKKFKNRMDFLKLIIFSLLIVFIGLIIRNMMIFHSIYNNSKKYSNVDNYYYKYFQTDVNSITIIESYNKGEKYLRKQTTIEKENNNSKSCMVEVFDGNDSIYYFEDTGKKINGEPNGIPEISIDFDSIENNILVFLKNCVFSDIKTVKCNGIECYRIINYSSKKLNNEDVCIYIDKNTGNVVRVTDEITGRKTEKKELEEYNMIRDFYYEYNSVKDSDLIYEKE